MRLPVEDDDVTLIKDDSVSITAAGDEWTHEKKNGRIIATRR